jgi:hypothetical protein
MKQKVGCVMGMGIEVNLLDGEANISQRKKNEVMHLGGVLEYMMWAAPVVRMYEFQVPWV